MKTLMSIINDFISLFFPHYCFCCSGLMVKGEDVFCTKCLLDLPKTDYSPSLNPVTEKLKKKIPITYGVAFLKFNKGGIIQHLLHRLKYEQHPEIGVKLGKMYGAILKDQDFISRFDLIIPVPLHLSKLRKRGYNQSDKFAEGLSCTLAVPWSNSIFFRKKRTSTQTNKSAGDRWENVKDAFSTSENPSIRGKKILLVDDVITTGATLSACGQHLLRAGCVELGVICIAIAE